MKTIKELLDKDIIEQNFLIREKNHSVGKNGRSFLALQLCDQTGTLDARVWDNVDAITAEAQIGEIVIVKGAVQVYQGRKQLVVHRLSKSTDTTLDVSQFMPSSTKNTEQLYLDVLNIIRTVQNTSLRQLMLDCFEDPEIKPLLLKAPAAKSIHHAWIGGLIEHKLSIAQLMSFIAQHYSFLNRDLLIFGALFHDLGKIWELSWDKGIAYTDRGRLIGHMEMACELIDKKSQRILGFDPELRDILKHIILSHHGKMEYGSPKTPQFLEALVVAMIDDFDSKVSTVKTLIENDRLHPGQTESGWTRYSELFDRYFLTTDLKEKFK